MRKATDRQRFRLEHAGFLSRLTLARDRRGAGHRVRNRRSKTLLPFVSLVFATILRFVRLLNWPRPLCLVLAGLVPAAASPVEKMVGKLFWVASLPGLQSAYGAIAGETGSLPLFLHSSRFAESARPPGSWARNLQRRRSTAMAAGDSFVERSLGCSTGFAYGNLKPRKKCVGVTG